MKIDLNVGADDDVWLVEVVFAVVMTGVALFVNMPLIGLASTNWCWAPGPEAACLPVYYHLTTSGMAFIGTFIASTVLLTEFLCLIDSSVPDREAGANMWTFAVKQKSIALTASLLIVDTTVLAGWLIIYIIHAAVPFVQASLEAVFQMAPILETLGCIAVLGVVWMYVNKLRLERKFKTPSN